MKPHRNAVAQCLPDVMRTPTTDHAHMQFGTRQAPTATKTTAALAQAQRAIATAHHEIRTLHGQLEACQYGSATGAVDSAFYHEMLALHEKLLWNGAHIRPTSSAP
jgi:hypothetical protein